MTEKRADRVVRFLVVLCSLVVGLVSPVLLPSVVYADVMTVAANRDSYVDQNNPGANRGTDDTLIVQSRNRTRNVRTFVGFDLGSLPAGATVNAARLRLYMYSAPSANRSYRVHRVLDDWIESGTADIAWNNQPNVLGDGAGAAATAAAAIGTGDGVWVEWDVTSDVQGFASGVYTNYGWRVADSDEDSSTRYQGQFYSREYSNASLRPQLWIDYSANTPTPTHTPTNTPTSTPTNTPTATATPACGSTYWVSPSSSGGNWGGGVLANAYADGAGTVSCPNCAGSTAWYGGYDFGLPGDATVEGIEVRLDWWLDSVAGSNAVNVALSWDGGGSWTAASPATTERDPSSPGGADGNPTDVEGGASNTWGRTWTAQQLSPANLRVRAVAQSDVGSRTFYLDWIPVRLHYCTSSGPIPPTPTVTSTPTPTYTPGPATATPTTAPTPTPTSMPAGTRFGVYDNFDLCPAGTSGGGQVRPKPPGLRECGNVLANSDFETELAPWVAGTGVHDATRSSRYSCDIDGRPNSVNAGSFSLLLRCDRRYGYGADIFNPWAFQDFTVPAFVSSMQEVDVEMDVSLYYVVPPAVAETLGRAQDRLRVTIQDSGGLDLTSPVEITNGAISSRGVYHLFTTDMASQFTVADYANQTLRIRVDAPNVNDEGDSEFLVDQVRCQICTTVRAPDPEPGQAFRLGGHLLVVLAGQPTEMPGVDVWAIQLPDGVTPPDQLDFQTTYAIQDSTYNFYNVRPGTYRIYAEVWVAGNMYSATQTVTIADGETNTQVNLTLL